MLQRGSRCGAPLAAHAAAGTSTPAPQPPRPAALARRGARRAAPSGAPSATQPPLRLVSTRVAYTDRSSFGEECYYQGGTWVGGWVGGCGAGGEARPGGARRKGGGAALRLRRGARAKLGLAKGVALKAPAEASVRSRCAGAAAAGKHNPAHPCCPCCAPFAGEDWVGRVREQGRTLASEMFALKAEAERKVARLAVSPDEEKSGGPVWEGGSTRERGVGSWARPPKCTAFFSILVIFQ